MKKYGFLPTELNNRLCMLMEIS